MEPDPWDDHAGDWDDDPSARAYAAAAFDSLRAVLEERGVGLAGSAVCDFGCGTGLLTELLVDLVESIDAVDTSPAMRSVLNDKILAGGWSRVRVSSELPPSDRRHDLVVCSSVCSFVDDYPGTVRDLAGRLRPGGVFVQWDWEREGDATDAHGLGRREMHDALTAAGLTDVHVDTAFAVEAPDGEVMAPLIGVGRSPAR